MSAATVNPFVDPWIGLRIARFRLLKRLRRGGTGAVYEAEEDGLARRVAVKLLHDCGSPVDRERFRREARSAARLEHPNVPAVFAFGDEDGVAWMAMQLVPGPSAAEAVRRFGPLPVDVVISVLHQAAGALSAAHAAGLVHRDIKPGNILFEAACGGDRAATDLLGSTVKLADFGLAKSVAPGASEVAGPTLPGGVVGTPAFMSPEQAQGFPVDARSDLYSLGATAYALLAGHPPFGGSGIPETILQVTTARPAGLRTIRPEVPEALASLISRLMAKSPAERPQSAAELLSALEATPAPPRAAALRMRLAVPAAAAFLVAVGALALPAWEWFARATPTPASEAPEPPSQPIPVARPAVPEHEAAGSGRGATDSQRNEPVGTRPAKRPVLEALKAAVQNRPRLEQNDAPGSYPGGK